MTATAPIATATAAYAEGEGPTRSVTVTLKDAGTVFPTESIAVQVTVVVPMPKVDPEDGEQLTTGEGSTMSVAVTSKATVAPEGPVASTRMSAGTVRTGGRESRTSTVKVAVASLPEESRAVQVTVVVPSGKTEPEAGEQTCVREPSGSSSAVTV